MIGSGVLSAYLAALVEALGPRAAAVGRAAGIEPALLARPDAVLPIVAVDRLWQAAAAALGDPAFGVEVGRRMQPGSFAVVGQVMMTAPDLGAALAAGGRLTALIGEGGLVEAAGEPGRVLMRYSPLRTDWPEREARVDAALAGSLTLARWITGMPDLAPAEVRLTRAVPRDPGPWVAHFAAPLRFAAAENALVWRREQMALPLRAADPALNELLRRHAEERLRERLAAEGAAADLRGAIAGLMAAGTVPSLAAAAARLGRGTRSLQRALDALGTSFSAERDRVRLAEARRLLGEAGLSIEAIAARLAYAEAAVFVRAFRRWTGQSPARFRRALSASPPSAS